MGRYTQGMVAAALAGSVAGCAAFQSFQPAAADSCRDSATGRFVSCGSGGGDSTGVLVAAGVVLGLAAVGGIIYLAARSPSQAAAPPEPAAAAAAPCELPAREVVVCESARGYRFAVPLPGPCAGGSRAVGVAPLTCEALSRPAYHACLDGSGGWTPVRSWETCRSRGMTDAAGDFVPPGRDPSQGVAPDATRPATAPELELVDPPRDVDPRHLCDGPDGFARVTPLTCGEHGYAYHEGPPPLGVVFGGGAPPDRYVAPERICVLRGRRVVVPAGHPCRLHDPDAARP